jgi:glycosyltransferase involved in cell wall biosynthesis
MSTAELLSILVPVYNEAGTVATVIDRLRAIDLPLPREIVVVDDGSTDGTRDVLSGLARRDATLRVIFAERNAGKGAAIRAGLAEARGTIIAIQDADLELDPAQFGSLVAPILSGATSVVFGSRFLSGRPDVPWVTVVANRTLTAVTNLLYRSHLTDMETCYKIMRTGVARGLRLESNRFDIEPEIAAKLLRSGHAIVEVPVRYDPRRREHGKKIRWHDGVQALRVLIRYRFTSGVDRTQP